MEPMCLTEPAADRLSNSDHERLIALAWASIDHGIAQRCMLNLDSEDFEPHLVARRSCFVTLQHQDALRGCIGHLEPIQPLVNDVVENAYSAAFRDPRFPPLTAAERVGLDLQISVLSPATRIFFNSEAELLGQIKPGVDGLILQKGRNRGTFLPSVWSQLPDPADFIGHLKQKAGLPRDFWSDDIVVLRYQTETFS